jgi:hypothetical protein
MVHHDEWKWTAPNGSDQIGEHRDRRGGNRPHLLVNLRRDRGNSLLRERRERQSRNASNYCNEVPPPHRACPCCVSLRRRTFKGDVQASNVRVGCAPCKGGAFQWVQTPPGNRLACHKLVTARVCRPQREFGLFDQSQESGVACPRNQFHMPDLKAALVERPFGFCRQRQDAGQMAVRICGQRLLP